MNELETKLVELSEKLAAFKTVFTEAIELCTDENATAKAKADIAEIAYQTKAASNLVLWHWQAREPR